MMSEVDLELRYIIANFSSFVN